MRIATVSVTEATYAKLRSMAEERGRSVSDVAEEWIGTVAGLPPEDQDLTLRVARVLRDRTRKGEWVNVIEVAVSRAEAVDEP